MKTGHRDAASLYDKLERVVVPLFYRDRERFTQSRPYYCPRTFFTWPIFF